MCVCVRGDFCESEAVNSFGMGTVFRRRNLTSVDVRFSRLKTIPTLKEQNIQNRRGPIT